MSARQCSHRYPASPIGLNQVHGLSRSPSIFAGREVVIQRIPGIHWTQASMNPDSSEFLR